MLIAEKVFDIKHIYTVKNINDSVVETYAKKICLIEVEPVNFLLKSEREQDTIIRAYKSFLKQCDFDMQLFVQTINVDMHEHVEEVKKCIEYEPELSEMAEDYIMFIEDVSGIRRSVAKKFFIVIEAKNEIHVERVIQSIKQCGNDARLCSKEECLNVYKNCYKNFDSFTTDVYDTQDEILKIYPSYFEDKNPNFLIINNKYICSLIITDYAKEMHSAFFNVILSEEVDLMFSLFYEKQSSTEVLKKLTYSIGNAGADIKTSNDNQSDVEILGTTYDDAKYIRRQIQLEQESLYNIYGYISVSANSKEELEVAIQKVEAICNGVGVSTRRALFRQRETFESCLPIFQNMKSLQKYTKRNVLTDGLSSTYLFLANELCDKTGILIGANERDKSLIMIDRFNREKYKNSNMCVIGTSGSGKSYFTKLMAIRNRYLNISQFIIDPEREYIKICKKLNGAIINFENGKIINLMDIREFSNDDGSGFLQSKIGKLNGFFSLVLPDITQEEKNLLEEKIIECYANKNITFDDASLYYECDNARLITAKRFKRSKDMPILMDLYDLIKKDKKLNRLKVLIKPYVSGSESFFNGYTNVDINNKFVVADLFGIEEKSMSAAMFVLTEFFWDKIKEARSQKKIIYLDEAWRLIGSNSETANFIYKIFKTIRKYGGAVTAITQDIEDFFTLEDGKFGKGILNNSSIKTIFQLEENEIKILKNSLNLSEEEEIKIQNAKSGSCLVYAGSNHVEVKVLASEKEHEYISTENALMHTSLG